MIIFCTIWCIPCLYPLNPNITIPINAPRTPFFNHQTGNWPSLPLPSFSLRPLFAPSWSSLQEVFSTVFSSSASSVNSGFFSSLLNCSLSNVMVLKPSSGPPEKWSSSKNVRFHSFSFSSIHSVHLRLFRLWSARNFRSSLALSFGPNPWSFRCPLRWLARCFLEYGCAKDSSSSSMSSTPSPSSPNPVHNFFGSSTSFSFFSVSVVNPSVPFAKASAL